MGSAGVRRRRSPSCSPGRRQGPSAEPGPGGALSQARRAGGASVRRTRVVGRSPYARAVPRRVCLTSRTHIRALCLCVCLCLRTVAVRTRARHSAVAGSSHTAGHKHVLAAAREPFPHGLLASAAPSDPERVPHTGRRHRSERERGGGGATITRRPWRPWHPWRPPWRPWHRRHPWCPCCEITEAGGEGRRDIAARRGQSRANAGHRLPEIRPPTTKPAALTPWRHQRRPWPSP